MQDNIRYRSIQRYFILSSNSAIMLDIGGLNNNKPIQGIEACIAGALLRKDQLEFEAIGLL